jgi:hypothetical protein
MTTASPKRLEVDWRELRELVLQTRQRNLSDTEFETLQATTETLLWVADQLKLRNQRLYRMLFGPSSEKTSAVLVEQARGWTARVISRERQCDRLRRRAPWHGRRASKAQQAQGARATFSQRV